MRHLTNEELLRLLTVEPNNIHAQHEVVDRFAALVNLETLRIAELESDLDQAEGAISRLSRGVCVCEL